MGHAVRLGWLPSHCLRHHPKTSDRRVGRYQAAAADVTERWTAERPAQC